MNLCKRGYRCVPVINKGRSVYNKRPNSQNHYITTHNIKMCIRDRQYYVLQIIVTMSILSILYSRKNVLNQLHKLKISKQLIVLNL